MPSLIFSRALTANQLADNPVANWQFEYIPVMYGRGAAVDVLIRATTTGVRLTLFAGTTTIVQRSPVQGGGTAGVTPSPLNTQPISFLAAPNDRLLFQVDEVAGGTPTYDGIIIVEPL